VVEDSPEESEHMELTDVRTTGAQASPEATP
jgi:hypothetical protein